MFRFLGNLLIVLLFFISTNAIAANYGRRLCSKVGYHCVKVKSGETWARLWPDSDRRRIVMRVNRMNAELRRGMVIAVPDNLNRIDHMDVAPMPRRIEPPGRKVLVVNLKLQAFGAYDKYGYLVHWGPISGGKGWCPDINRRCRTPTGNFYVFHKKGANCISTKYPVGKGGAPMPYCMFFYGGYAMHASFLPGYNASHGCVRMFYEDAKWLNQYFVDMGRNGTKVWVRSLNDFKFEMNKFKLS